jgi:CelD/BcsL family acetyltransferase involved in cellulose biosynthesis
VLELSELSETSALLEQLRDGRPPAGCRAELSAPTRIHYTPLPKSWDAYLGTLSSHARYSVRNLRRKFLALPGARLFEWTDADRLDRAVDRLIELHTRRWEGRAEHCSFSTAQYNDFHRDLMHSFLELGWLRLYCMELAGELIGMFYGYAFRGTLYHFQGGFDPAHEKLRIGQCLMAFAIESAIAERCTSLDMLRGEYEYKKRWAPSVRQTYSYQLARATPSTYVSHALDRIIRPAGRRSYRLLKSLVDHRP